MKWRIVLVIVAVGVGAFFLFQLGTDDPIVNVPPKNDTIVAFGDSLVEGVGGESGGFVSILSRRLGVEIVNHGSAGDTTADGVARIDAVLAEDPGVVIILFGGNDALRRVPLAETEANLAVMVERFTTEGIVVVLLGVRGGILGDPYDTLYESLSKQYDTAYVPNVLEGIMLRPEYTADQLHPNSAGYEIIADRIEPILRSRILP